MTDRVNGLEQLQKYIRLQNDLCNTLMSKYSDVSNWKTLYDLPRNGAIDVQGDYWEFVRHGSGVLFTRVIDLVKVDIPKGVRDTPKGLDGWRLVTYFESLGIDRINYNNYLFEVDDDGMQRLIEVLKNDGFLVTHESDVGIYQFSN